MKPLRDWDTTIGTYKFKTPTYYGSLHLGVDHIVPTGSEVRAPFNGAVNQTYFGAQGGNTLIFQYSGGYIRFMHLSGFGKTGTVQAGDTIAYTGNTGSLSTAPHLHTDLPKSIKGNFWEDINNFSDPLKLNWEDSMNLTQNQVKGRAFTAGSKGLIWVDQSWVQNSPTDDKPIPQQWASGITTLPEIVELETAKQNLIEGSKEKQIQIDELEKTLTRFEDALDVSDNELHKTLEKNDELTQRVSELEEQLKNAGERPTGAHRGIWQRMKEFFNNLVK